MNLTDIQNFIQQNYVIEVFVDWQPSEYDMKYKYNTPRKQKKIDKDRAAINLITQYRINNQTNILNNLKILCKSISNSLPSDVASLFFDTISWNITDMIHKHEQYLNKIKELESKYLTDDYHCIYNYLYRIKECKKDTYSKEVDLEKFKQVFKDCIMYKDQSIYTQEYCNQILKDDLELSDIERNDVVLKYKNIDEAKRLQLKDIITKIYGISNQIVLALDRKQITSWERENNWGVGGYYNGILKNVDNKTVSFKSFIAGGHNIQRRHIRCRVTVLKNKEEHQ